MLIKDLIKELKKFPPEMRITCANDEELNSIMTRFEVAELSDFNTPTAVIYPLSGTEIDDDEETAGSALFKCPNDSEMASWNARTIAEKGTPVCPKCDSDMEVVK